VEAAGADGVGAAEVLGVVDAAGVDGDVAGAAEGAVVVEAAGVVAAGSDLAQAMAANKTRRSNPNAIGA
jgi:hypothetical protein